MNLAAVCILAYLVASSPLPVLVRLIGVLLILGADLRAWTSREDSNGSH